MLTIQFIFQRVKTVNTYCSFTPDFEAGMFHFLASIEYVLRIRLGLIYVEQRNWTVQIHKLIHWNFLKSCMNFRYIIWVTLSCYSVYLLQFMFMLCVLSGMKQL